METEGRIVKLLGGFYYVSTEDGAIYKTRARGIFRHQKRKPLVGDYVELLLDEGEKLSSVEEILPRKNSILRPPIANVDQIFLFVPTANPKYNFYFVDKMLAYYEFKQIKIVPIISKYDRDPIVARRLAELYKDCNYEVYELSEADPDSIEALRGLLFEKTTALSGVSGSGKTTFLNHILGLNLQTGDVSEKTNRGKHTTRHIEIFSGTNGMYLFDTPGFSSIDVTMIPSDRLSVYFREFHPYSKRCRFQDCTHRKEPGCVVRDAYEEGLIMESRYKNYLRLYDELVEKEQSKWR